MSYCCNKAFFNLKTSCMNAEKSVLQSNDEQFLPRDDELIQVLQHLFSVTSKDNWPDDSQFDMELREELYYSLRDTFEEAIAKKKKDREETLNDFILKNAEALFYSQKSAFENNEL